ncbi:Uncharacterized protein LW93_5202 [Fusarium fujikuroi]|nr:Uncharacterized protein LW93_5202 [Fusarium fujikuroi]
MLPFMTCFVAGLQYLIHPLKLGTIQETINPDALIPITLLSTEEIFGDLEGILQLFDSIDDVFVPDFGSILVEKSGDNNSQVRVDTRQIYHMDQIKALDGFSELPSGPYFLYGPNLYQAWRLYDDEFGAFTSGVIPDDLNQPDEFDKTRIFSRSLKGLLDFTANAKTGASEAPPRIIVPDDLSSPEKSQKTAIATFVSILQDLLDTKAEYVNVGKIWEESPPSEASREGMQAYMEKAPFRSWCYDYYHSFDAFRDEYKQKFDKKPFIEATPQFFWNECKSATEEENRQDTERLGVYRKWFLENIMHNSIPNAKGDAVVILPCGNTQVEHRNDPLAPPTIYKGIDSTTLAPILGASVLWFPFTQVPYESDISGETEYQPVCISVLVHGNEKSTIQLIKKALETGHIPTKVDVGRYTFPVKKSDHVSNQVQAPLSGQNISDEL